MRKESFFKNSILLIIIGFVFFQTSSCSDITKISKEQLKEYEIILDGPGSKMINEEEQPLWVINGKIVSTQLIKRLKPKYIDSISVLKESAGLQRYGNIGKNGVIKIYADRKIFTDLEPDSVNKQTN